MKRITNVILEDDSILGAVSPGVQQALNYIDAAIMTRGLFTKEFNTNTELTFQGR